MVRSPLHPLLSMVGLDPTNQFFRYLDVESLGGRVKPDHGERERVTRQELFFSGR